MSDDNWFTTYVEMPLYNAEMKLLGVFSPTSPIGMIAVQGTLLQAATSNSVAAPAIAWVYKTESDAANAATAAGAAVVTQAYDGAKNAVGYLVQKAEDAAGAVGDAIEGLGTSVLKIGLMFAGAYLAVELLTAPARPKSQGARNARA